MEKKIVEGDNLEDRTRIAVLVPCYNEETTIGKVVDDFRRELPGADIFVFDNCCTDDTARVAKEHGAIVRKEPRQGKGYVIERMFDTVNADYYIMVDGDDTYSAEHVHSLLKPVIEGDADLTVGTRLATFKEDSFRPLHYAGNSLVRGLINTIFGTKLKDIMSGYRVFNRRAALRIPVVSEGFEVETEMTIRSLYYKMKIVEVDVPYGVRPEGSESKLRTFRDGFRVLWQLFSLFRAFKPLVFFGVIGLLAAILGGLAGAVPIRDYISSQNVTHIPLAILASGLMLVAMLNLVLGIILHAVNWRFKELHNVVLRGREWMI